MNNWFFLAFLAPFLWSVVNIIDQFLVDKFTDDEEDSTGALVLFSSLVGFFVVFLIGFFVGGIFSISFFDKFLLFISGILTIFWVILYLFALKKEDVSSVVPWFLTAPVFTYLFGFIFLGEDLNSFQKIGSLIIVFGIFLLSLNFSNQGKTSFRWTAGIYMLPACILISLNSILFKYVTLIDSFWITSFWVYLGLGISGLFIYLFIPNYRFSFLKMLKNGGWKIFSLNFFSEILGIIGNLLTGYATLLAPVVLVSLVSSLQPAVLLLLTILCTIFFPHIIKEDLSLRVLLPKIISIIFIITGSIILFF